MNVATLLGVAVALAAVTALIGVVMRLLRRLSGMSGGRRALPMEVVERVAVGPRQGVAVVRIGSRVLAVSVGEGGVRTLAELEGDDRDMPRVPAESSPMRRVPERPELRGLLRAMKRSAVVLLLVAGVGVIPATSAALEAQTTEPDAPAVVEPEEPTSPGAPTIDLRVGEEGNGGLQLTGAVGVVVMMGLLTLLPALLLLMTSFTRILIVLHLLRQALGTQTAPPAHLLGALALLLTGFVMAPTLGEFNETALQPWMEGEIEQAEMLSTGVMPFREFMARQTRDSDLATFVEMSEAERPADIDDVPLTTLMSAFAISELRTAFQIGFALFLPFIVIDLVVAAVLMSMGMFMLPPAMISLPFKLLLFVMVDGWSLLVQGVVSSFG